MQPQHPVMTALDCVEPQWFDREDSIRSIAVGAAERGLRVFPCFPNKKPAIKRGFLAASNDAAVVRAMEWQNSFLIGAPTGAANGFVVLDIDPKNNGHLWFETNKHRFPDTLEVRTESGGCHIFFRYREAIRNSNGGNGGIAPGVDVRGDGGYVVVWQFHNGEVLTPVPFAQLADWPDWLSPAKPPTSTPTRTVTSKPRSASVSGRVSQQPPADRFYAQCALAHGADRVRHAVSGSRNDTLNHETFTLGRFVAIGSLKRDELITAMAEAAVDVGLERKEIIGTIKSALNAAMAVATKVSS